MSALTKRRIRSAAKKLGFFDVGSFLIGNRTEDIVSGFAIDATPSATYIWTFILPRFDNLSFLHMSLGERVIDLNNSDYHIEDGLRNTWSDISGIVDAGQLISYLDTHGVTGEYASWVRFICFIRLGAFDEAERLSSTVDSLTVISTPDKLKELQDVRQYGGWPAAQDLLNDWALRTDRLMEGVPFEVSGTDSK